MMNSSQGVVSKSELSSLYRISYSAIYNVKQQSCVRVLPSTKSKSYSSARCSVSFLPCIDIHKIQREGASDMVTNFESDKSAGEFANLYKMDGLTGGHVIMLGADPLSGLQIGGGINSDNALSYLHEGASHVIVTSYVFNNGQMELERLKDLVRVNGKYAVVTDRWQKFSDLYVDQQTLDFLATYADEFLVHGVDVEGKRLGSLSLTPSLYISPLKSLMPGMGRVDVTVGSALDIFGGDIAYIDVVAWHKKQEASVVL
ncbi:hypothetical protein MKX03_024116 [Papaver bracteatum]|nr:hypothetical protein MKX03_024116 [Papaver bracteatum]